MLKNISLRNFKSHKATDLDTENITLLTGTNGVGKSSIFQTILLLRQSFKKSTLQHGLELKGELCDIGTAKDALYQSADDNIISIAINDDVIGQEQFNFNYNDNKLNDTYLKRIDPAAGVRVFSIFSNDFQYISAFRNGPSKDYDRDTSQVEHFRQISSKEGRCELSAHYLDYYGKESISSDSLMFDGANNNNLHTNVQLWMGAISRGIEIIVEPVQNGFQINYKFSRGSGKTSTDSFRAVNIGFGISYVLPIVIAALHSKPGSIILIENPEAHIHPAGQSKLMELICKAAKAGVQFLIETHSDHIINGTLVGIKNKLINSENVSIYFFDRQEESHETVPHKLSLTSDGRITDPIDGFFDQIDIDMKNLLGF